MLTIILVFAFSLTPTLVSLWIMGQLEKRTRERLRAAREMVARRELRNLAISNNRNNQTAVADLTKFIGDINCSYNARSPYLRCAVNPDGPCQDCLHYKPLQS